MPPEVKRGGDRVGARIHESRYGSADSCYPRLIGKVLGNPRHEVPREQHCIVGRHVVRSEYRLAQPYGPTVANDPGGEASDVRINRDGDHIGAWYGDGAGPSHAPLGGGLSLKDKPDFNQFAYQQTDG